MSYGLVVASRNYIVIPRRGSEMFLSFLGLLEHRINLYDGGTHERGLTRNQLISGGDIDSTIDVGKIFYVDIYIMASTAVYENEVVISVKPGGNSADQNVY